MNVRNCRKCGRIFNYVMGPIICPRCREDEEAKFQEVKAFVIDHKGADVVEVANECDVDPGQIRQWIREERLQFADDSPIRIPCESCGAMIRSGRFCDKCKAETLSGLQNEVQKSKAKPEPPKTVKRDEKDKMRFLDSQGGKL